ncbi:hypothetical protein ACTTAF_17035 [Rhodobacter capsulatus]|uniref:hypothetical protein n=1 Tax=Rhodobacter capsulatus TaxID=1061 RepID=UPI0003D2BEA1|nr:hypothetical protein [Rhodobacter capsulatus]ETD80974.1 hypothetical protein U703_17470 [Rhodobacter capsulatus YW1]
MGLVDIFITQIGDPLRVILLAGVIALQPRLEGRLGRIPTLAAGLVLVALVIPLLFPNGNVWFLVAAAIGLVTNAIQMGVLLGIWTLVRRFKH